MFTNTHNIELLDGSTPVTVKLRLSVGAQIELADRWKENTIATLLNAGNDINRLNDVLTKALKFKGSDNTIQKGSELIELLADNGLSGMAAKQKLLTAIGVVSGIVSEDEKAGLDKRTDRVVGRITKTDADEEDDEKN